MRVITATADDEKEVIVAVLLNGNYDDPGWRSDSDKSAAGEFTESDFLVLF